jgi:hypothetical protein
LEKQYPQMKWDDVQKRINAMLKKVCEAAVRFSPPLGIQKTDQAAAAYGVDIMLDKDFQPKLLGMQVVQNV